MSKRLTEAEEQLLQRFEKLFGRMSSETALSAAIEVEAAKRRTPLFHAQYAFQQIALERYAELREKEEVLSRLLIMEPGKILHFTQLEENDHV